MARALGQHQRRGAGAVVIGTDQPDLARLPLADVLARLDDTIDMLMAPTHDGGYWLIGAKRRPVIRPPFAGVRWSTGHARADTLANLERQGATVEELFGLASPGPGRSFLTALQAA